MRAPNILLIVMDCTRPDHLRCYGYERPTSPTLDRLASEGVLFQNAFSSAVWTLESIASLYTGLFSSQHGVNIIHQALSPKAVTLATFLQESGYETAAFTPGSWHGSAFGYARGFDIFRETYRRFSWLNQLFPQETLIEKIWRHIGNRYDKGARNITQAAVEWLGARDQQRPFFGIVHYVDPHLPYQLPDSFANRFLPPGVSKKTVQGVNQDAYRYMAHEVEMNEEDFAILRAIYDGSILYTDSRIGEIIAKLESNQQLDDTLIIVLADHGENLGEHGLMDHQYSVHDTLTHIPLIMRLPGIFQPGANETKLVQNIDIFPTIIEILGKEVSEIQPYTLGKSVLNGEGHPFVISEYLSPVFKRFEFAHRNFDTSEYDRKLRAIRDDKYKFIWSSDASHELYCISSDPEEEQNLITKRPQVAAEKLARLDQWERSLPLPDWEGVIASMDAGVERRLRDLGYL